MGNHRSFIVFLVFQTITVMLAIILLVRALVREVGGDVCQVLGELLGRRYFFVLVMGLFLLLLLLGMVALLGEQLFNMARNIVRYQLTLLTTLLLYISLHYTIR